LRYRLLKATGRPGRLQAVSLEVTHRCICRCQMCNIWQIPSDVPDLPLDAWTDLLSSPGLERLVEIDITGGEPFLRRDLAALIDWIGRARAATFPALKTLAITTNGLLTDRVLAVVGGAIGPLRASGIDLVLACGVDAVGPLHDRIRNFRGAWEKLTATLAGLEALRNDHANLVLGLKTTIVPANVGELDRLAAFADEHGLFTIISPRIITANRFGNTDLSDALSFSPADRRAMARFYARPSFAWGIHRQTLLNYLETGTVAKPCSAGFNTVFVRHTGEVFPCPLIPRSLGNIRERPLKRLLETAAAARFRRRIGALPECRVCTEPGLERIAWPYQGLCCLNFLARRGWGEFLGLARHMGLDKYL
jgi:MoaA/NifB/PqqE/SkfB family radical SAM enzyme